MDLRGLVYPRPDERAPQPPPTQSAHGHRQHDARGEEDFAGLRKICDVDDEQHAIGVLQRIHEPWFQEFVGNRRQIDELKVNVFVREHARYR